MAFWNRNDDYRRQDWRDAERERELRRERDREEHRYARDPRELGYGEGMGMRAERYGEERFGFGRHERERGVEGRYSEPLERGGSYYGQADYGIGPGGWREQGRAMMDDRRYRSDMPGMHSRGDYGMDDYRTRDMGRDWQRTTEVERERSGFGQRDYGRYGMSYGMRDTNVPNGTAEKQIGGRGPRSYTRSDERIREDVCERLMASWMNAEDVDVRVDSGEVTLTGQVDSRHEKRAIEDVTEMVLGVREVHNQLRVRGGLMAKLGMEHREEGRHANTAGTGSDLRAPASRPTNTTTTSPTNTTGGNGATRA